MRTVPLWFVLALLCALSWSVADVLSKYALRRHALSTVVWARWGYALPLLLLLPPWVPLTAAEPGYWAILLLAAPLEVAAGLLYLEALRVSPMSLAVPFLAWTPVFTALASLAMLGELPGVPGAAGILLVALGSFVLALERPNGGGVLFAAFRREKGIRLILAVAVIYSVTSALGKLGVLYSSPTFFARTYALVVTAAFTLCLAARRGLKGLGSLRPDWPLLGVGAAAALMIIFHFTAIERTQVAYMISVKRSSLLFSVVLGNLVFDEKKTGRRFLGAVVMGAGMLLLLIGD